MLGSEQFLRAIDSRLLDDVAPFTTAVVALARIAFGVLVGKDRAGGFKHGFTNEVLRGDQFQAVSLSRDFVIDCVGDYRIDFGEWGVSKIGHWLSSFLNGKAGKLMVHHAQCARNANGV